MNGRRSTYFAFQGLFVAVLMLVFLYQDGGRAGWVDRFTVILALSGASLLALRLASDETLSSWWLQVGLFVGDAGLASLILGWTEYHPELFLIYFLIIFGAALTRNLGQSLLISGATVLLFLFTSWDPRLGLPRDTGFWLKVLLLLTSSAMLTLLSRDSHQVQADQERRYRGRLVEFERLATLGQVAGEVAHRIKGPLTTIMVNAELLSHRSRSKEFLKELKQIQDEVGHCKDILKSLLDIGRLEEIDPAPIDLREPLRFALRSIEPQARRHGLDLHCAGLDEPLRVTGDHSLLQEAFAAVLQNAVEASRRGGRVRVSVEKVKPFSLARRAGAEAFVVVVEDEGKGIAWTDLERIFQPFYTTKGPQGDGLGLSAALRILQKHGGSIEAHSAGAGRGSRFRLRLPAAGRA